MADDTVRFPEAPGNHSRHNAVEFASFPTAPQELVFGTGCAALRGGKFLTCPCPGIDSTSEKLVATGNGAWHVNRHGTSTGKIAPVPDSSPGQPVPAGTYQRMGVHSSTKVNSFGPFAVTSAVRPEVWGDRYLAGRCDCSTLVDAGKPSGAGTASGFSV